MEGHLTVAGTQFKSRHFGYWTLINFIRRTLGKDKLHRVLIIYKSGVTVIMKCTVFTAKRTAVGTLEFEWEGLSASNTRPLLMNIENIESVWQLS